MNCCAPAVICGHFHIQALEVTTDGFAKVLAEDAHHGPGEKEDDAALVEELEHPVVDVRLVELKVFGNVTQQMCHFRLLLVLQTRSFISH